MTITDATPAGQLPWDQFVMRHYPPVGAFMQAWAWGEFQKELGRDVGRYAVMDGNRQLAAFTMIRFDLPMKLHYAYVPRGPVIATDARDPAAVAAILEEIKNWSKKKFPRLIFIRLEPPILSFPATLARPDFHFPKNYIQPRHNATVPLVGSEIEIAAAFHPSTRSNLNRAKKRGVTVAIKTSVSANDYAAFADMIQDTIARNHGKDAYPSDAYFRAFLATIPFGAANAPQKENLSMKAFYGYHEGVPVSAHFVLFFGETATYLYGASRTDHLNSKVDTYLHWAAMREAKRDGYSYYDLGGIDDHRWPSLTTFKRQFHGTETSYAGNIDIPIRPAWHRVYSFLKSI